MSRRGGGASVRAGAVPALGLTSSARTRCRRRATVHKPESVEPGPPSGKVAHESVRAPSAWGAVRDALSAVHNLGALLRNAGRPVQGHPRSPPRAALQRDGAARAFARSGRRTRRPPRSGSTAPAPWAELDELLDAIAAGRSDDRAPLAATASTLADELEASRRSARAARSRGERRCATRGEAQWSRARRAACRDGDARARESSSGSTRPSPTRQSRPTRTSLGPLLSLLVACAHARRVQRAWSCVPSADAASRRYVIEAADPDERALPTLAVRVLPWVPPAENTARAGGRADRRRRSSSAARARRSCAARPCG